MKTSASGIAIKPHHFVDIITSFGKGRREFPPHPYGHSVHLVSERILNFPQVGIIIELAGDDICKPCKYNSAAGCTDHIDTSYRPDAPASKNEWNLLIDRRWCERLNIRQGDRMTALELCRLILHKMGDITDIYCEIPAAMTAERMDNLKKGLTFLLGHAGSQSKSR